MSKKNFWIGYIICILYKKQNLRNWCWRKRVTRKKCFKSSLLLLLIWVRPGERMSRIWVLGGSSSKKGCNIIWVRNSIRLNRLRRRRRGSFRRCISLCHSWKRMRKKLVFLINQRLKKIKIKLLILESKQKI